MSRQKIQRLSGETSDKLCAAQVVPDLISIIKQLVDNAIDAKASIIRIQLFNYGKSRVEVIDNGGGISFQNLKTIANQGATSKLQQFDQINNVTSLGFRGQALSSISAISKVTIQSMHKDSDKGYNFSLVDKSISQIQTHYGTKVIIDDPYYTLPVRKSLLETEAIETTNKIIEMIKQYGIIYVNIQFILHNNHNGRNDCYLQTGISKPFAESTWRQRIQIILGHKVVSGLAYISSSVFEGWVISRILSGSMKPQDWLKKKITYMYCNKRPINFLPSFMSVLDEVYKQYNSGSKYVCIINLKFKEDEFDINVSPDKRQICWTSQQQGVKLFRTALQAITEKSRNQIKSLSTFVQKKSIHKRESVIKQEKPLSILRAPLNVNIKDRLSKAMQSGIATKKIQISQKSDNSDTKQKYVAEAPQISRKDNIRLQQNLSISSNIIKTELDVKKQIQVQEIASTNIQKSDFQRMKIVGQFNCGFIICQLDDKFFLVDQHAADQKKNYQQIINSKWNFFRTNTKVPLTPEQHDRLTTTNRMQNFGYKYQTYRNEQGKYQVLILQMPIYFGQVFRQNFFLDTLNSNIQTFAKHPTFQNKAATFACRKSIMVGDRLRCQQMQKIVCSLSKLQSPWNCPHGRPTCILLNSVGHFLQKTRMQEEYLL